MEVISLAIGILGVIGFLGAASIWFARGRGNETIRLLEINVKAYQESEKLKDQKIAYLEGQLVIKDETIKRILNNDGKET
jgi:hypothetical protein